MPLSSLLKRKKIAKPSPGEQPAGELDVLRWETPPTPSKITRLRIGNHTSTSGGVEQAVERAYRLGCNTLQVFSSSPRTWRPTVIESQQCVSVQELRMRYGIGPMVIHTSYLVNMCSKTPAFLAKSVIAFRTEVERALQLGAEYLVLHPGSFKGGSHAEGLDCAVESIQKATDKLDLGKNFKILIENTAGAEYSLGASFEQVALLLDRLRRVAPVGACIDTCHTHVAGYDIVSEAGFQETMLLIDRTIGLDEVEVWHCNDAKAHRGSRLDRHQHIGKGTIGLEPFRRLLNDPRVAHAAFMAETPIDEPGDDFRNVEALKKLVK